MIKLVIAFSIAIVVVLPNEIKYIITIALSIIWFFYTIQQIIKMHRIKEKKITTDKYSTSPPNNNHSAYIRYLYKGKIDYKVFVATIMELILRKSISFVTYNGDDYHLIDNKNDEDLSKSEKYVKKILFKDIGDSDNISLNLIKKKCASNSGYIYSVYKEWQGVFEYECAYNKYFKSNKNVVEDFLMYFILSLVISIYNIFFTRLIWLSIVMLCITGYLCKYISDMKRLEDDVKKEYEDWLRFKNYISKHDNSLDELDIVSLENYATYAYVLDSIDDFVDTLNKKNSNNANSFNNSVLLTIMHLRIFDYMDKVFKEGIHDIHFNSRILFSKNKGRR